jgi:hypothetical protein
MSENFYITNETSFATFKDDVNYHTLSHPCCTINKHSESLIDELKSMSRVLNKFELRCGFSLLKKFAKNSQLCPKNVVAINIPYCRKDRGTSRLKRSFGVMSGWKFDEKVILCNGLIYLRYKKMGNE